MKFSPSSFVTTYLRTLCTHGVSLDHIPGTRNVLADYFSRNPPPLREGDCQVCAFVDRYASSAVRDVTGHDVLAGSSTVPFSSRAAWSTLQQSCPQLQRVRTYLDRGTRPTRGQARLNVVELENTPLGNVLSME